MKKLRIRSSCVFSGGDRAAGEVLSFDVPPPDAAIVVGAGLAEWIEEEEDKSSTGAVRSASLADEISPDAPETSAVQAPPAARTKKKKAKK